MNISTLLIELAKTNSVSYTSIASDDSLHESLNSHLVSNSINTTNFDCYIMNDINYFWLSFSSGIGFCALGFIAVHLMCWKKSNRLIKK